MSCTAGNAPEPCFYLLIFASRILFVPHCANLYLAVPKPIVVRKFISRIPAIILLLCISLSVSAQKTPTPVRCGAAEYLETLLKQDPSLKARMQADEERLNQQTLLKIQQRISNKETNKLDAIVTIPVVVHILLPDPNLVTDADINWQISKLNEDFGGTNADKVNAGVFASSFGQSQIRFCLAQQDPAGNPTNGIDRVATTATWNRNTSDLLKRKANCGADSWDANRYFNIWVARSTDGTLGIATFPNSGVTENQGIVIALSGFSNNPAYVSSAFNLGRTAVHEAGHFFYARHIWGDGAGCQPDFPTVAGLPAFVDDTPAQNDATSGCPAGVIAANCSGSLMPPGRMYQNYMDYTNDACYCMFTLNQVARMESALTLFRSSLLSSNACTPPAAVANDAALNAILSPAADACGGGSTTAFCSPVVNPKVSIKNYGSANLTSLQLKAQIDNGTVTTYNWTGNLAPLGTATINLAAISTVAGSHNLKIYAASPNGATDGRNSNDTLNASFTILAPTAGPVTEGFESATFPPAGWTVQNPNNGSLTWERTTAAKRSGSAAARIRFYDYVGSTLHQDFLLSPVLDVQGADSVILSFERAYKQYSTDPGDADTLAIVVSFDCGATFTEVWKRGGADLATAAGVTTSAYVPVAADWLNARINLKPFLGNAATAIVGFKTVNRYGNNLYIDDANINIFTSTRDLLISSITEPAKVLCTRNTLPVVQITSGGTEIITNAKILFRVDNGPLDSIQWTGSLAKGQSASVTLKNITLTNTGAHLLTVYTKQPNGLADAFTGNDTSRFQFTVSDLEQAPLKEGFEAATFPPANWALNSSGNAYTWEQTNRSASEKTKSAWIRNYRFAGNGKTDDLYTAPVQVSTFDSVVVRFDLSHILSRPAGSSVTLIDTLEVLLTKDCGKTFQSVYKKWGAALQTTGTPGEPVTYPANDTLGLVPNALSQWRPEYIDLSKLVTSGAPFQVVFRNTGNRGNNILLDNISITPVILPALLKEKGYLLSPNPFEGVFTIRHLEVPVKLQSVQVANAMGKVVYKRQFNGNATTSMSVFIGGGTGVYYVTMKYTDKTITERLVKLR